MELGEFQFLVHSRRYVRGKVTRICNSLVQEPLGVDTFDLEHCKELRDDLIHLKDKLQISNTSISKSIWLHAEDQSKLDEEISRVDEYDGKIYSGIRLLENRIKLLTSSQNTGSPAYINSNV